MISEEPVGRLVLVPTPLGNLGDITLRALEVLKNTQLVLAEDTRHTLKLLSHFEIRVPLESYHQHNEHHKLISVIDRLKSGMRICYCTDAGTPGISDPGFLLVRACVENNIDVECLPGPTALIPAAVVSGFPCDRFVFEGFLPQKKGRMKRLESLKDEHRTIIFYESPHRIVKTIGQLIDLFGEERNICVCKELTKVHEQFVRGAGSELIEKLNSMTIKGEFVIVVEAK
jgi:16S rRNA (cytidine1402-2'-O)-methyltransferase